MRVSHHASSGCVIGAPPSPASANASLTYPGGLSVSYTPNALGQPTQAGTFVTNVSYWPNGAIKQFTYGNGIVHTLTRNARGLPEASKDAYGTTNFLYDAYDYDQAGNVAAITDGATGQAQRGNRTMSYDGLDRLTGVTSPMYGTAGAHYTYDVLDNLVHTIAVNRDQWLCYDQTNRLSNVKANGDCSTGSTILGLGFDPQGNLANWNGVEYTFDYGNRLRQVEGLEAYRYDGHGRRVLATSLQGLGNLLSMYGQAGQLLYQQDSRSGQWRDFVYLGGSLVAERAKAFSTGAATVTYQHTDALGTPVAKTNASRVVVQRSEYEPFGKLLNRPLENGPGYTGHVTDAATQLTYMQQRYYDPRVGRFWSVDPVTVDSVGGNFNRYWYANNNPYKFSDPDGRLAFLIPLAIIAYKAYSAADTIATVAENAGTVVDSSASTGDRVLAATVIAASVIGGKVGKATVQQGSKITSRAARREAQRQAGIPTSRAATAQSGKEGQRQYVVEGADGKPKAVTQHQADKDHANPHWHAADAKTDPVSGQTRTNKHGQLKYESDGTVVEYDQ